MQKGISSSLKFFLDRFRVDLLQDSVVKVLECKKWGHEDSAEADGQNNPHEAAINHCVNAVA